MKCVNNIKNSQIYIEMNKRFLYTVNYDENTGLNHAFYLKSEIFKK